LNAMTALLLLAGALTPQAALQRIQSRVVVAPVSPATELAGKYSDSDGLSASELYLFPDSTYVLTQWADIAPLEVHERGTWQRSGPGVLLSVQWRRHDIIRADTAYVALRWPKCGILLVGVNDDLRYFEENARQQPRVILGVVGLRREMKLTRENSETERRQLPDAAPPTPR
jgi:hypothetical protein